MQMWRGFTGTWRSLVSVGSSAAGTTASISVVREQSERIKASSASLVSGTSNSKVGRPTRRCARSPLLTASAARASFSVRASKPYPCCVATWSTYCQMRISAVPSSHSFQHCWPAGSGLIQDTISVLVGLAADGIRSGKNRRAPFDSDAAAWQPIERRVRRLRFRDWYLLFVGARAEVRRSGQANVVPHRLPVPLIGAYTIKVCVRM
jgi:hypothetical protein